MAWADILRALLLFLPAYVANMAPVFVAKLVPAWKAPIDGGRIGKDGMRILGPGKTWRGLVGGTLLAGITAIAIAVSVPPEGFTGIFAGWDYGYHGFDGEPVGSKTGTPERAYDPDSNVDLMAPPPPATSSLVAVFLFGAILGFAALVGDAVKSYFKRRRKIERGGSWFPFDQLDFVVFGILGMLAAAPLLADGWLVAALLHSWVVLATLLVLTPALHLLVNRIGYWLGLKEVPW